MKGGQNDTHWTDVQKLIQALLSRSKIFRNFVLHSTAWCSTRICTFGSFPICIQRLKSLEREYKEWDFSKVNFSQTDTEKMKLNIAIKKYNDNSLKLMDYKLYDVFEAQRIAKEEADEAIK